MALVESSSISTTTLDGEKAEGRVGDARETDERSASMRNFTKQLERIKNDPLKESLAVW